MSKGCCTLDHRRQGCVDLSKDDSHCANIAKCCVGVHHAGDQKKCLNAVRDCRGLGNNWDPIGPLKALDVDFIYNDLPGYSTQGKLVLEHFGMGGLSLKCILNNSMCGLVIAFLIQYFTKNSLSNMEVVALAVTSALIKCMLERL